MIDMNIGVKSDTVEASNVELSVKMSIIYALNEEYIFVYPEISHMCENFFPTLQACENVW